MSEEIHSLSNHKRNPQRDPTPQQKKKIRKASSQTQGKMNEIRDLYIAKETPEKHEYSRDPKLRKILLQQAQKAQNARNKPLH